MSITEASYAAARRTGSRRRVAVIPVFNEEDTVVHVLQSLEPLVDDIVVVDDGSTDRSRGLILQWSGAKPHVHCILFPRNRGLSAGYHAAFTYIGEMVTRGELGPDDAIITIDADGQHRPSDLDRLVQQLDEVPCDAVVARRDLSGYTWFKRFGNWALSLWASLWAGQRLHDVESGLRVFRAGPLVDALKYYHGYRYSETVEVAVVLARLGYKISNDVLVPVPVQRSRTRLLDGVIDALAMVGARWRVLAGRHRPSDMPGWSMHVFPLAAAFVLAFIAIDMLVHPLFLASDSMLSYAHVWYVSEQIYDHASLPVRVAFLDSGRAITFPYALVPYLLAAIIYPLFGDWAVTLLMVVAVLGSVYAAGLVRPVMRDPWMVALFLLNPFFIDAVFAFQFASLWAALFFFLFVWAFERKRFLLAGALAWLTITSHPIIGSAVIGAYALCLVAFDRQKLRPLVLIGLPVGLASIPSYWMTFSIPAVHEDSFAQVARSTLGSIVARTTFFAEPFLLAVLAPYLRRFYRPALALSGIGFAAGFAGMAGVIRYDHAPSGYYGAFHSSSNVYAEFFQSSQFHPGAHYRLLEPSEREDGMYRFIKHGAVLSNEFFTESVFHRGWSEPQYACYTAYKGIDYVVFEKAWWERTHMNEGELLQSLVSSQRASIVYTDPRGRFTVYDVRPFVAQQQKPASLNDCHLF